MAQSIQDLGDRYVLGNDDGTWVVYKQLATDATGKVVGPGYIAKGTFRNNGRETDAPFMDPMTTLNDPLCQGIAIAGWHHYRDIPGEPSIWNKGWDMGGARSAAARGGFGVSSCDTLVAPYVNPAGEIRASFRVNFVDPWSSAEGKRVASVRYDYIIDASQVKCWTTLIEFPDGYDAGPKPYVKEPKYVCGVGGSSYQPSQLLIFDDMNGTLAAIDLVNDPRLQDPTAATIQVPNGARTRIAWLDGVNYLNVVARGNTPLTYGADGKPSNYGTRGYWAGAGLGLDQFAVDANSRVVFDPSVCAAYCKQGVGGTLSRKWEVAKRGGDPHAEVMFHGWEGGSGLPDCLCCAVEWKTGNKWTNFWSISRDAGWTL